VLVAGAVAGVVAGVSVVDDMVQIVLWLMR
jgi:hypothetical protein